MRNSIVMLTFSVLDRNYPFGTNLVQKFKLLLQAEISYLDESEYAEFSGDAHFFYF